MSWLTWYLKITKDGIIFHYCVTFYRAAKFMLLAQSNKQCSESFKSYIDEESILGLSFNHLTVLALWPSLSIVTLCDEHEIRMKERRFV